MYRVLIADDEAEFRKWLRSLLECSEEFRVVGEAETGTEAIELVASLDPDIVIADVYMPGLDGLEVARHVQQHFPGSRVILISAHQDRIYKGLAREEGALAFIPKSDLSLDAVCQTLQVEI